MVTRRGVAKWPVDGGRTASRGLCWSAAWAALAGALVGTAAMAPRGGHTVGTTAAVRGERTVDLAGSQASPTRAIERVALGDRVAGRNPLRDQVEPGPEPDPASWRRVDLRMAEPGGRLDIGLLRPLAWVQAVGAKPGATIALDLADLGAAGAAAVVAVGPCPPIAPGPGRVVTGTFAHESAAVLDLRLEGQPRPIGLTAGHPFYSEDRAAFVPAGGLRPGERLRGRAGPERVASVVERQGRHRVFNLEIYGEHVYQVTTTGVLVHNSCAGFNPAMQQAQDWLSMRGFDPSRATPFASRMSARFGGGRINGMRYGSIGYRIEFDTRSGAHINVFAGKEIGPHFTFSFNEGDMLAVLRQLFGN